MEWTVSGWREEDVVRSNGVTTNRVINSWKMEIFLLRLTFCSTASYPPSHSLSPEEDLGSVGWVLSRSRTGSGLRYSSFPLAEKGLSRRNGSSGMASQETTAIIQAGHEGGWTGVVAVQGYRGA